MWHDPWHDLLSSAAAAVLVGGGALFIVLSLLARRDARSAAAGLEAGLPERQPAPVLGIVAMALALGAALIHLAAAPSHIDQLGLAGWGFVGAALFQGAWALSFRISPTRGVAVTGIAGSLAIVAAWAWTRTAGLPIAPFAGVPEPIGLPDAAATAFELALVGLLVARLEGLDRRLGIALRRAPSLPAIAVVPAVGMVVVGTTLAVTLALDHVHEPGAHDRAAGVPAQHDH